MACAVTIKLRPHIINQLDQTILYHLELSNVLSLPHSVIWWNALWYDGILAIRTIFLTNSINFANHCRATIDWNGHNFIVSNIWSSHRVVKSYSFEKNYQIVFFNINRRPVRVLMYEYHKKMYQLTIVNERMQLYSYFFFFNKTIPQENLEYVLCNNDADHR